MIIIFINNKIFKIIYRKKLVIKQYDFIFHNIKSKIHNYSKDISSTSFI